MNNNVAALDIHLQVIKDKASEFLKVCLLSLWFHIKYGFHPDKEILFSENDKEATAKNAVAPLFPPIKAGFFDISYIMNPVVYFFNCACSFFNRAFASSTDSPSFVK